MSDVFSKKFEISKLFDKVKYKKLPYKAGDLKELKKDENNIPVLSAGIDNQGLAYYAPKDGATVLKNVISVSANGANSGAMFYQPYDFTILQDSYAIKYKLKELNENEYLYLLVCLQKVIRNNYSWTNKAGWERIKTLSIELPVDKDGNILYSYMDKYIEKIKNKETSKISTKLEENGLSKEPMTEEDKTMINDFFAGKHTVKKIKVRELFDIKNNLSLDKSSLNFTPTSEYPYFTRTVFNNGIAGYVDYLDDEHLIKGNSIAVGLLQMQFFYMSHDFYTGQFTKTIFAKFDGFNEQIGLFFCVLFNKQSPKYSSVLVRDFDNTFYESEIEIPVDSEGKLDLDYIKKLMSALKKNALQDLDL